MSLVLSFIKGFHQNKLVKISFVGTKSGPFYFFFILIYFLEKHSSQECKYTSDSNNNNRIMFTHILTQKMFDVHR